MKKKNNCPFCGKKPTFIERKDVSMDISRKAFYYKSKEVKYWGCKDCKTKFYRRVEDWNFFTESEKKN